MISERPDWSGVPSCLTNGLSGAGSATHLSRQQQCGSMPFLIQRDGTWLYKGPPIRRKPMVCLFASVLRRDDDGIY